MEKSAKVVLWLIAAVVGIPMLAFVAFWIGLFALVRNNQKLGTTGDLVYAARNPRALLALDRAIGNDPYLYLDSYDKLVKSLPPDSIVVLKKPTSIEYEEAFDRRDDALLPVDRGASGNHILKVKIKSGDKIGTSIFVPERYAPRLSFYTTQF